MDIVSVVSPTPVVFLSPDPTVARWADSLLQDLLTPEHLRFAYRQGNLSMEQVWAIAAQTGLDVAPWGVLPPSASTAALGESQDRR